MASITVDILAKVVGYLKSLSDLLSQILKLDPGASLSKNITKAFELASNEVKSLSKNMMPKASSDSLIDAIAEKANHAGESILNVVRLLQLVTTNDLNFSSFGSEIDNFRSLIAALESDLTGKINSGILSTVESSLLLKDIFATLGTDLTKADASTLFSDLLRGALLAAEDVKKAEAEVAKIESQMANTLLNLNKNLSSVLSTLEGRMGLDPLIENITKSYDLIFSDLRTKMQLGLTEAFRGTNVNTSSMLDSFFKDLTPENIKEKIGNLFNDVTANGEFVGLKRAFYQSIFGLDEKEGFDINSVIRNLNLGGLIDLVKLQFSAFLELNGADIKPELYVKILRLINENSIKEAAELTKHDLDSAFGRVLKALRDYLERFNLLTAARDAAQLVLTNALERLTNYDTAIANLQSLVDNLKNENLQLLNLIAQLRELLGQRLEQITSDFHSVVNDTGKKNYENVFPTAEINAYKALLQEVVAKELLLGKVLGVVQRWFSVYAAVRMVSNAIKSVINTLKELDSTITEIAIVTDMSQSDLWALMPLYSALALQYAASLSGVYQVSLLYYQLGLLTADVMALTELTLKMARISGLDYAQATDYMTNAVRSFKMEMTDALRVVDVYSAIAASSASSVSELASAMSKTASSAQAVGSSFENTTAMMAVMIEATRESAENIGSALKSIISRYGEMKADPTKLVDSEGEVMSLNKVDTALLTVGISIHNAAGEFRDFDEVIMELAEKWDTIDTNTLRYIATVMAGNRLQSRFLALVSSYDRLEELSSTASDSEDASQLLYLKTLDSIDAKVLQLLNSILSLYTNSGLEKIYKNLLTLGNNIVQTFSGMPKLFNLPITALASFGALFYNIASIVTRVFAMIKADFLVQVADLLAKITAALLLGSNERIENVRREVLQENEIRLQGAEQSANIERNAPLMASRGLGKTWGLTAKTASGLSLGLLTAGAAISFMASGMKETNLGARLLKGSLTAVAGVATTIGMALNSNWIGAIVMGVTALINTIDILYESAEERALRLKEEYEEANNKRIETAADYKDNKDEIDKLKELEKARFDSAEAAEAYFEASNKIAEEMPELIGAYDTEGNAIINLGAAYDVLKEKRQAAADAAADSADAAINLAENAENTARGVYEKALEKALVNKKGYSTEDKSVPYYLTHDANGREMNETNLTKIVDILFNAGELDSLDLNNVLYEFIDAVRNSDLTTLMKFFDNENNELDNLLNEINSFKENETEELSMKGIGTTFKYLFNSIFGNGAETNLKKASRDYTSKSSLTDELLRRAIISATNERLQGLTLDAQFGFGPEVDYLSEFNAATNIINQAMLQLFEQLKAVTPNLKANEWIKTDEAEAAYIAVEQDLLSWWNSLLPQEQDFYNDLVKNKDQYTDTQLIDLLSKVPSNLQSAFLLYFKNTYTAEDFEKALDLRDKTSIATDVIDGINLVDKLSGKELLNILTFYNNLDKKIESGALTSQEGINVRDEFLKAIITENEELLQLLFNTDIFSFSDILATVEKLLDASKFDLNDPEVQAAINSLLIIGTLIPININTEIETILNRFTEGISDAETNLKNIKKGMDFKTMAATALKMGKSVSDFHLEDGKYYINDYVSAANDLVSQTLGSLDQERARFQTEAKRVNARLTGVNRTKDNLMKELGLDEESYTTAMLEYAAAITDKENPFSGDFVTWYIQLLMEKFEATAGEAEAYIKQYVASTALEAGDIASFLELALPKDIFEKLSSELKTAAISSIALGQIPEELSQYLDLYSTLVHNSFLNVLESIANALIDAVGDTGTKTITVTKNNIDLLQQLKDKGWITGELKAGKEVTIEAEKLNTSAQEFLKYIATAFKTTSDKIKALSLYHKNKYTNSTITNLSNVAGTMELDTEKLLSFFSSMGYDFDKTDYESVFKANGLDFNSAGEPIIKNYATWIATVESRVNLVLIDENASLEEKNLARTLLAQTKGMRLALLRDAIKAIIDNYNDVSDDLLKDLASSLLIDVSTLDKYVTVDSISGKKSFNALAFVLDLEEGNIEGITEGMLLYFKNLLSSIYDDYSTSISNTISLASSGTTKIKDMQSFVDNYNQMFKSNKTIDDLFQYNVNTLSWILKAEELRTILEKEAESLGLAEEDINQWIEDLITEYFTNLIDISDFLNAEDKTEGSKAYQKLYDALERLYQTFTKEDQLATGYSTASEYATEIIKQLSKGGIEAANALKNVKPDATAEELEEAYYHVFNELLDASEALKDIEVGSFVTGKLKDILSSLGMVDDDGTVNSSFDMVEVYNAIYEQMKATNTATILGLNSVYALMMTALDLSNIDITDLLNNVGGMSYDAFGLLLANYGIKLETVFDSLESLAQFGVKRNNYGQVILEDFNKFKAQLEEQYDIIIDETSQEYFEAYSAYVDARVERANLESTNLSTAVDLIKSITEAKAGESLNVYAVSKAFEDAGLSESLVAIARQYGAILKDGMLTITTWTDIPGMINEITRTAADASILIPELLAELSDAVREMLTSITSLIKSGISGSLSNTDALKLSDWAKRNGIAGVAFTETAEGLQLTSLSLSDVYVAMKRVDSLLAQSLIPSIMKSKTSYLSLAGTLMEFNDLLNHEINNLDTVATLRTKATQAYSKAKVQGTVTLDMTKRPQVYDENGNIMTYNSISASNEKGQTVVVTPILPDGTVISDDLATTFAEKYANKEINLATKLTDANGKDLKYTFKDIFMGLYDNKDAAEAASNAIHDYNEALISTGTTLNALNDTMSTTTLLLTDIVRTHLTSADSMNFMSTSLPENMQAAVNAWENASTAIKDLTTGKSKGYMGVQDFYNIVTTSASLLEAAGRDFSVKGMNAAELMEKAGLSLKIVDGKLQIDLSSTGMDISGSIGEMQTNMTDAMHELALALIDMLDAEIEVLEVFAAMEQLGDVDVNANNINFEIEDIFTFNGNGDIDGFTSQFELYTADLLKLADDTPELYDALNRIKIGGTSLYDLLKSNDWEAWKKAGFTAESMSSFFLTLTEDWDLLGNLQEAVMNKLMSYNLPLTVDISSGKYVISMSGNPAFVVNYENEDVMNAARAALEKALGKEFGSDSEFLAALDEQIANYQNLNTIELTWEERVLANRIVALASGSYTIKEDENGEKYLWYNGKRISGHKEEEIYDKLAQAMAMTSEGMTIDVTESGEITGTMTIGNANYTMSFDGKNVKCTATDASGTTLTFEGENALQLALAWLASRGSGEEGQTYTYEGKTYTLYVDANTGITYSYNTTDKKYECNGHEFDNWDALSSYLAFEDENKFAKVTKLNKNTEFRITGLAVAVYDFTDNTTTYWFGNLKFATPEDYVEYVTAFNELGTVVNAETGEILYLVNGCQIAVSVDAEGQTEYNVTFSSSTLGAGSFTAHTQAELETGLAAAAALNVKGGTLPADSSNAGGEVTFTYGDLKSFKVIINTDGTFTVEGELLDEKTRQSVEDYLNNLLLSSETETTETTIPSVNATVSTLNITSAEKVVLGEGFNIANNDLGNINPDEVVALLAALGINSVLSLYNAAGMTLPSAQLSFGIISSLNVIAALASLAIDKVNELVKKDGMALPDTTDWETITAQVSATLSNLGIDGVTNLQLTAAGITAVLGKTLDIDSVLALAGQFNLLNTTGQLKDTNTITVTGITNAEGQAGTLTITKVTGDKTVTDLTNLKAGSNISAHADGTTTITSDSYKLDWTTVDAETGEVTVLTITVPADLNFGEAGSLAAYLALNPGSVVVTTNLNNTIQDDLKKLNYSVEVTAHLKFANSGELVLTDEFLLNLQANNYDFSASLPKNLTDAALLEDALQLVTGDDTLTLPINFDTGEIDESALENFKNTLIEKNLIPELPVEPVIEETSDDLIIEEFIEGEDGVLVPVDVTLGEESGVETTSFNELLEEAGDEGGENLDAGVKLGVEKGENQVLTALEVLGTSSLNTLETALQEQSPSKATDEMGLNLDAGLVQGIEALLSTVTEAGEALGLAVIEAISLAITEGLTTLSEGITEAVNTIDSTYTDLEQKTESVTNSVKSHWETLSNNIRATVELIRQLVLSLLEKISITWSIGGDNANTAGTGSGAGTYGELTNLNNYISEVMASMERLEDGSYTMKLPKLTLDTSATNLDTASIADTIVEALSKNAIDVTAIIGTITPNVTNAVIDEAGISEAIASKEVLVDEIKAVPSKVDASDLTKIDRNLGTLTMPTDAKMMIGNPIKAVPSRLQLDLSEVSDISALDDGKQLEVDVDITPAEGKISDLLSQIDSLRQSKKVPVIDVDTSDAKGKLEEIIELIDTIIEKATLIITIDAADETSVTLALLDKIMNTLIIIEGKNNIPLTITLKANGVLDTLEQIASKLQEIAANANLSINIEANGEEPEGGEGDNGDKDDKESEEPSEGTTTESETSKASTPVETTQETPVLLTETTLTLSTPTNTTPAVTLDSTTPSRLLLILGEGGRLTANAGMSDVNFNSSSIEDAEVPVTAVGENFDPGTAEGSDLGVNAEGESFDAGEAEGADVGVNVEGASFDPGAADGADVSVNASASSFEAPSTAPTMEVNVEAGADSEVTTEDAEATITYNTNISGDLPPLDNADPSVVYHALQTGSIPPMSNTTVHVKYECSTTGNVPSVATGTVGMAGGNLAQAQGAAKAGGTPTLMGELGPELVVSNGRYFVAGLNGAEFVNLDKDAIVFNHLQTESLLTKGMSKERGRAVTNERNAISFAKGNAGPAMASASAALSQLKTIRAMWQKLLTSTVKDLAGLGGSGGGGGGSDGSGNSSSSGRKSFLEDVERWYNLLQEIAKLEKIINHEETLRSKLENDLSKDGKAYYNSLKLSIAALSKQIKALEELNISRREYFNKRRKLLNEDNGPFNQLYTFDEQGQINFNKNTKIKGTKITDGQEFLSELVALNTNTGKPKYTVEELYNMLKAAGFEEYMKYDSSGNEITLGGTDSDDGPTEDDYNTYYSSMVLAFWDRVESLKTEMQTLYDSIADGENSLLELEQLRNELLLSIYENLMAVEDSVLAAIEDMKLREIDALLDERDKLESSVNKYIDGLTDALDKEREMYNTQENLKELDTKKRRLGILLRSGASAEDIYSLLKEITESEKDMYFDAQLAQINAIQEASLLEIDRLDSQIAIMQETLDYQKEMGLLWYDVYKVMSKSDAEMAQFIVGNNSEFWKNSPLKQVLTYEDTLFKTGLWEAFRNDVALTNTNLKDVDEDTKAILSALNKSLNWTKDSLTAEAFATYNETMAKSHGENWDKSGRYRAKFEEIYRATGDRTKAATAASELYENDASWRKREKEGGADFVGSGKTKYVAINDSKHWKYTYLHELYGGTNKDYIGRTEWFFVSKTKLNHTWEKGTCSKCGYKLPKEKKSDSGSGDGGWKGPLGCGASCSLYCKGAASGGSSSSSGGCGDASTKAKKRQQQQVTPGSTTQAASGGYVGHGFYELGEQGTETVLTAEQTRVLRNNILSNRPSSLISLLRTYNEGFSRMETPLTGTTSEDNSTNIDKIELTMNVSQIANDYDAKRAGEQALTEMLRIAKKTSANNSVRR